MNPRCASIFPAILLAVCSISSAAQTASAGLPQDPLALMTLAQEKNGLVGPDVRPWHMRGRYHAYKWGKLDYEGIFEEWWFSPTRYKLTFSNPHGTQTDYATGTELLRDGVQGWLDGPELLLHEALVDPMPDPAQLKLFKLHRRGMSVGRAKLECVILKYKIHNALEADHFPTACFESKIPVLRTFWQGNTPEIQYDHIVLFQDHYIARQIRVLFGKDVVADLNLDVIEAAMQSPQTVITPPTSAVPVDLSRIVKGRIGTGFWPTLLVIAEPDLPLPQVAPRSVADPPAQETGAIDRDASPEARAELNPPKLEFPHGTVRVKITIQPDGHVGDAQVIDGPMPLRKDSLDAARQWVFRPFEVMGDARPVVIELAFGWVVQ